MQEVALKKRWRKEHVFLSILLELLILRIFIWNKRVELFVVLFGVNDASSEKNGRQLQETGCRQDNRENAHVVCDFIFKLQNIQIEKLLFDKRNIPCKSNRWWKYSPPWRLWCHRIRRWRHSTSRERQTRRPASNYFREWFSTFRFGKFERPKKKKMKILSDCQTQAFTVIIKK